MKTQRRFLTLAVICIALAFTLFACSSDGGGGDDSVTTSSSSEGGEATGGWSADLSGTWSFLIDGETWIEIHFTDDEEYGTQFGYHYHDSYNFKSADNASFTVEEEDGSAEYTVIYSLDGNKLTISDNGGLPYLDNGVYYKRGSVAWSPALLGTWSGEGYSISFADPTDDGYATMTIYEDEDDYNYSLVEFNSNSFKVLGMMGMVVTVEYSLSGGTFTIIDDEGNLDVEAQGAYRKE